MAWPPVVAAEDRLTAWLHVPSVAGSEESWTTADGIADRLLDGRIGLADLGAPFGLVRWAAGRLDIVNDALGLVRLFRVDAGARNDHEENHFA